MTDHVQIAKAAAERCGIKTCAEYRGGDDVAGVDLWVLMPAEVEELLITSDFTLQESYSELAALLIACECRLREEGWHADSIAYGENHSGAYISVRTFDFDGLALIKPHDQSDPVAHVLARLEAIGRIPKEES